MVKDGFELTRTDSFCPSPADLLLDYVRRNNITKIQSLVRENRDVLSHVYDYPHHKTILQICCCKEDVQPAVVEALVGLGANLFFAQEVDNMRNALHIAALYATPEILRTVVKCMKQQTGGSINDVDANGNTALHIVVKEREEDDPNLEECARILVENGIDVNKTDGKMHTAILWAAKSGYKGVVRILLQQANIDIDSCKLRNKTARQWITEKRLVDEPIIDYPTSNNNENPKDVLFGYLKDNRESDFVNFNKISAFVDADDGANTLLQVACKNGLKDVVRHLLNNGADPNHTTSKNPKTPLEIISELGYYEIFDLLLRNERTEISNNVICNLFKYMDRDKIWISDYEKCYQLLKDRMTHAIVNDSDEDNNTPLHYAVFYSKAEGVLELLDLGASLANKNRSNISPIHNIHADVLEQHLDKCIRVVNTRDGDFNENCVVSFNYRTLVPHTPETVHSDEKSVDVEQNPFRQMQELVAETEVVSYVSQSTELRHLLKHPVLSSFLFMKWHRIRWFFYTNLAFYLTFCMSLILYILLNCTDEPTQKPGVISDLILIVLAVTYVILIIRELFQMVVSPSSYFLSFENWVEICLIIVTLCIFLDESENKQFSAIAVLLATFELTMLVGQHPKICTNVVMLRTVSYNFFKILLWFSVLILAFAFSFYVLFHHANDKSARNSTDEETDFFGDPGLSVLKTIVMLTGEFDASSMNFTTFPLASRLIFLMFVFMIAIILLNLLNGLAVSDTQMIKNDAELIGLVSRAQHIRYIESMILGNILPTSILRLVNNFCCCLPIEHKRYLTIPRTLAERVCLFPRFLPNYLLKFYPVKHGEVISECPRGTGKCFACCSKVYLDGKTVRRTLWKLHHTKASTVNGVDCIIKQMQEKIELMQKEQAEVLKKMDLLLTRLDTRA